MTALRKINIPFPGLYETHLAADMDDAEAQLAEELAEETGNDESVVAQALYDAMDYGKAHAKIAAKYAGQFFHQLKHEGLDLEGEFDEMVSPREYNFTTDRLFAKVAMQDVERLRAEVPDAALAEVIKARHSSYSGFISFYSNQLATWNAKPLAEWDANELGTLLLAAMQHKEIDTAGIDDSIRDTLSGNGDYGDAVHAGFDRARFDDALLKALAA